MWLSVNFKLEAKLLFTRFLNWQKGRTELLQSYKNAFLFRSWFLNARCCVLKCVLVCGEVNGAYLLR